MKTAAALAMLAASLACAGRVEGGELAPRPILVRIQGHAGPAKEGDRSIAHLTFRRGTTRIDFMVEEIWVLSGDAVGLDVLHEVEPYTPSMTVSGPREVVDRLFTAAGDQPLEVMGYYRRGQRLLMVSDVKPLKKP